MVPATVIFVTQFLCLVSGLQTVEVAVSGPVAAVELRVDGAAVGVMRGEPWRLAIDLGNLRPLILEAVALDERGAEIARDRQLVNLPRPRVQPSLTLDRGEDGLPHTARLDWESVEDLELVAVEVTLDGQPIAADDPAAIPLPPYDSQAVHFLRANLEFFGAPAAHAEVMFGGLWKGETAAELTGVPVLWPKGMDRATPESLQGTLLADGDEVRVVAVEGGPPNLVVVVDRTAVTTMCTIEARRLEMRDRVKISFDRRASETYGRLMKGPSREGQMWLVTTVPDEPTAVDRPELFPLSQPLALFTDGIMWVVCHANGKGAEGGAQQVADAVSVAGRRAADSVVPRAVLVVLGSDSDRGSRSSPEVVRAYLRSLNVPLFVWAATMNQSHTGWGEVVAVTSPTKLGRALLDLRRHLERQRIVWLEGAHLPNRIEPSPDADWLALAR